MSYQVQTKVFEGPFDLLLHLILKDDVDLYEVNLSSIVDEYIDEVKRMETCDLEVSTEFLLIAATLIELKCRRLLPSAAESTLDEELGIWEERDMLLARLLECKTFKDASSVIEELLAGASLSVPRSWGLDDEYIELTPDPLEGMTTAHLKKAFIKVTSPKPKPEVSLNHVAKLRWSVSDAIERISSRLTAGKDSNFSELITSDMERLEVVVHFLAVLELFKQGALEITQANNFADMSLTWIGMEAQQSIGEMEVTYDG